MAEAAFDTIAEVQRLRNAGFAQEQAEAITRSIHAGVTGGVATKADLDLVRADLEVVRSDLKLVRQEMQTVKVELEAKIDAQGERLDAHVELLEVKIDSTAKTTIIWLGSIMFALAVALGVIGRLLPPPG